MLIKQSPLYLNKPQSRSNEPNNTCHVVVSPFFPANFSPESPRPNMSKEFPGHQLRLNNFWRSYKADVSAFPRNVMPWIMAIFSFGFA